MKLFYRQIGSGGPNVFLLHGLYGNSFNWASIAQSLSNFYQVFSFDLRNHGHSPSSSFMDYFLMAEDICQTTEPLGLFPVHLVGHSLGGKLAMVFALSFPQWVKSLVVVDIAPVDYGKEALQEHLKILETMRNLPLSELKTRKEAEMLLLKTINNKTIVQFLLTNLEYQSERYGWRINLEGIRASIEKLNAFPDLHAYFPGRTLFIAGERSNYLEASSFHQLSFYFPKATVVKIRDAGHWVHFEKPKEFLEALIPFLKENSI
ncbi:alpha/beta hydrolase [Methylacidiphilum kamchatkense Kam1]|uniref:Abhydrolase domain-containing protein 11 n=1 Tax=Methylacidiphilum kamchatkense Kam1 TaxID=1202785 RepID=A0A0C1RMU4_9BACT|nr:alpha/beta fold hydrolase [Methylacidiphilum kamchatkense]KIE59322.1 alpha/beta hydrolase [Methylacidiphilum kamchatkense Kam1]QDQ42707.1 abhydrolase domain-containing protein 11 [Methylacidiphilum kamchatkense Kam1]